MDYREERTQKILEMFPQPVQKEKSKTTGSGLINTLIDGLPVPLHLPGYKYAGPGTHLDLNLERNVRPKNKLDEACMHHDISYAQSDNLKERHKADNKLEHDSWKRVIASDSDMMEKLNSWLVTNVMKIKQKMGAGLRSYKAPNYVRYPVNLDQSQQELIRNSRKSVVIQVQPGRTKDSVMSGLYLPLTQYQIKKIRKGEKIRLSLSQLKKIKTGGFLPLALASIPAIASIGSLISSAVNTYNNKKANDALVAERKRHNQVLEGSGIKKKIKKRSKGEGIYLNKKSVQGNGLYQEFIKKKKSPLDR